MIDDDTEECGLCNGTGEECESRGIWQKCSLCGGTGEVRPSRGAEQSTGRSLPVGVGLSPCPVAEGSNGSLKADAARYRWLRSEGLQYIRIQDLTCDTCDIGLDHAIDTRLSPTSEKQHDVG